MTQTRQDLPVVVAITGASGAIHGIELLKALSQAQVPTHLVISRAGRLTIELETDMSPDQVEALAGEVHAPEALDAAISSGSFLTRGMVVAPCSIKSLSAIANSLTENLVARAADVHLKERRPLILMVRESPLHAGHLDLMARAARLGAVILPPMAAFYHHPQEVLDIVHHSVGKALDQLGVEHNLFRRWTGA